MHNTKYQPVTELLFNTFQVLKKVEAVLIITQDKNVYNTSAKIGDMLFSHKGPVHLKWKLPHSLQGL